MKKYLRCLILELCCRICMRLLRRDEPGQVMIIYGFHLWAQNIADSMTAPAAQPTNTDRLPNADETKE